MTHSKSALDVGGCIRRLLLAWLLAANVEFLLLPRGLKNLAGLDGLAAMSLPRVLVVTAGIFLLLHLLARKRSTRQGERWLLTGAFGLLAGLSLVASFTWPFLGLCLVLLGLLIRYALRGWDGAEPAAPVREKPCRVYLWITVGLTAAFFLFVSVWTVCRVWSFAAPSYDFGIFAQMFHNMKTTGLPMTTLERDGMLSHFRVHVSPIYYLLLPFYALAPAPATLQVLQAAVLASAVIPLWKLGKRRGLHPLPRMLLCGALLLYPALSGGAGYDIHENCFLTPLILWLLYGMDQKSTPITGLAALLTLMVKEDAAVYVAVAGLYLLVRALLRRRDRWELLWGSVLLVGAVAWFLGVTTYLARVGDGVMTYRYRNFMYDGSGSLFTVIKSVLLCPTKALFECVDVEKLNFIALTLLPLLGLPLLTRQYEGLLLLIPYVLVNLMSDYRYQHDIFFQYTFGSLAFLFYLTVEALAAVGKPRRKTVLAGIAAVVSALCFFSVVFPRAVSYPRRYASGAAKFQAWEAALDQIPADASVAATTFFTVSLSQREILYDVRYASREHLLGCEYVVLNPKSGGDYKAYGSYQNLAALLEREGYTPLRSVADTLVIYQKTP